MKFKSKVDEEIFRQEFLRSGLSLEEFLIKRQELEFGLTDWERSQRQKHNWWKYRWKYLKGIRRFHNSTQGKRFHRNLGRFLATRDVETILKAWQREKGNERDERSLDLRKLSENLELAIALLSSAVHALIEKRYYDASIEEAVQYNIFLEELLRVVQEFVQWLFDSAEGFDVDFVVGLVHPVEWGKLGLECKDDIEETGGMVEWLVSQVRERKVRIEEDEDGEQERTEAGG